MSRENSHLPQPPQVPPHLIGFTIDTIEPWRVYTCQQAGEIFNRSAEFFRKKYLHDERCYVDISNNGQRPYRERFIPGYLLIEYRDEMRANAARGAR